MFGHPATQVWQSLMRRRPKPQKWPEVQTTLVKLDPDDASRRLGSKRDLRVNLTACPATPTCFDLDMPEASVALEREVVAAPIHLRAQHFDIMVAAAPKIPQQFAEENVLDQLLALRGM
jgi:hypothetical protein